MKLWNSLYDKVKVVLLALAGSSALALIDVFTSFDWTGVAHSYCLFHRTQP